MNWVIGVELRKWKVGCFCQDLNLGAYVTDKQEERIKLKTHNGYNNNSNHIQHTQ